ncbi:MAG TPA: Ig-like domain-containing protein [Kofleriaceae bacterium]|nr:Ig-like domain-containing protein [Kofleriaceae bacterium]
MRASIACFGALLWIAGCSSVLGISDPTPAGNTDGGPGSDGSGSGTDGPHELVSIAIDQKPLDLPLGKSLQLTVHGNYADQTTEDLTAQAVFTIIAGDGVTLSAAGVVKGVTQGSSITVKAVVGNFADQSDITVVAAAPDHIELSVGNLQLDQQQRVHVRAAIVFTDNTKQDGTTTVTWQTSDASIATVVQGQIDAQQVAGDATITASAAGVTPASLVATVTLLPCHPVINEVQSGSSASASEEWAEIYNPCTISIAVDGFTLVYRAASNTGTIDTNLLINLVGTMAPGEIRLYGGDAVPQPLTDTWGNGVMQQNNGALGLRNGPKDTGPLVDAMAYGSISAGHPFIEGAPAAGLVNGRSVGRKPFDGNDTNQGSVDFALTTVRTPGTLNFP